MTIKVARPSEDIKEEIYLVAIVKGMGLTLKHLLSNLFNMRQLPIVEYPEKQKQFPAGYRGKHRLTKREDGSVRCVACYMCATACPAECIHIVAEESPDPTIEKRPARFDIDLLECVFCGMCVEACPVDAIRMDSGIYSITDFNRKSFVITKEELMNVKPQGMPE
ncbi:MAG TPA: NADH-quinone oxidoreductase subunit I [Stenomitos sp.]